MFIAGKQFTQKLALNFGLAVPLQVPHPKDLLYHGNIVRIFVAALDVKGVAHLKIQEYRGLLLELG